VAWLARETGDGRGLEWVRTCRSGVLDITAAAPEEAVLLRGLARVSVEVLSGGSWTASFDSADQGACLPAAVRIGLAYLRNDGAAGPLRYLVIDLPQMALDPTQQAGSGS
jgi:hypothetical protein